MATTWDQLLGESALLVRLGQLVFIWSKDTSIVKVVRAAPSEGEAELSEAIATLDVALEVEVPPGLVYDGDPFAAFCRKFVGAEGGSITAEEAVNLFACFSGGQVDGDLLNSVTPKLEAIAERELVA
jgi:hypothetical protein